MENEAELVTIASFHESAEAEMAKGRLQSAGIDCFLVGENTAVLYGNAIGGLQLQVNAEDESDARAALDIRAAAGDAERAEAESELTGGVSGVIDPE